MQPIEEGNKEWWCLQGSIIEASFHYSKSGKCGR
jgi:hypothetical protein